MLHGWFASISVADAQLHHIENVCIGFSMTASNMEGLTTDINTAVKEFSYIRFTVLDMNGVPRGYTLPSSSAVKFLQKGIGCHSGILAIDANNKFVYTKELVAAYMGNALMIPDLGTLHPVPWLESKGSTTAEFMCGTYWTQSVQQEAYSRGILTTLLKCLDNFGLQIYTGVELECILLEKKTKYPIFPCQDLCSTALQAEFHPWLTDMEVKMQKAGVSIERMHTEYSPGQFEFTTSPEWGVKGIDGSVILKQGVREMAAQRGWEANFMAKRDLSFPGNGLHLNFSIWNQNKMSIIWDGSFEDNLSTFAKNWIGGMIHHAGAITALSCPTTNCYLRLHGKRLPHVANWGIDDRNAMIRVKTDGPDGTYIENRLPSGLANPYLATAVMVAAGLDGVERKLPCPKPHEIAGAAELPRTLHEALQALQEDEVMVEALGKTFVEWFVKSKTEGEVEEEEGITDMTELLQIQTKKYARLF